MRLILAKKLKRWSNQRFIVSWLHRCWCPALLWAPVVVPWLTSCLWEVQSELLVSWKMLPVIIQQSHTKEFWNIIERRAKMLFSCNYCAKCVLYFLMLKAGATLLSLSFRQTLPENGSYCKITTRRCFAFFLRFLILRSTAYGIQL